MSQYHVVKLPLDFKKTLKETIDLGKEIIKETIFTNSRITCWKNSAKEAAVYTHFTCGDEGLYYAVESFSPRSKGMVYHIKPDPKKEKWRMTKEDLIVTPYKRVLNKEDIKRLNLIKKINKIK